MKPHRHQNKNMTLCGSYSLVNTLMASKTEPLPKADRERMVNRLLAGLEDIAKCSMPNLNSWRDLADCMNWLQSAVELEWTVDPDGAIQAAKAALLDGHKNALGKGKLRMSGPSLMSMRNMVDQFSDLLGVMTARNYWTVVGTGEKRVSAIWRGKKKVGDVVVSL